MMYFPGIQVNKNDNTIKMILTTILTAKILSSKPVQYSQLRYIFGSQIAVFKYTILKIHSASRKQNQPIALTMFKIQPSLQYS